MAITIRQTIYFAPEVFFSWDNIFKTSDELVAGLGEQPGEHRVKPLPPRFDFFEKHPSPQIRIGSRFSQTHYLLKGAMYGHHHPADA